MGTSTSRSISSRAVVFGARPRPGTTIRYGERECFRTIYEVKIHVNMMPGKFDLAKFYFSDVTNLAYNTHYTGADATD